MSKDANAADFTIGVVGTGTMGRGIAQIMAVAGMDVRLFDVEEGAAVAAREFVTRMLNRATEKGNMEQAAADAAIAKVQIVEALSDMAGADLVVEAIVENIDIKRSLLSDLEAIVGPDCILASNTSSLSVTAIAAGCKIPGRVTGYHFFNPVPLLKLVEVVSGLRTDAAVADTLVKVAQRAGHEPVRVTDSPGFLVNHAGRGLNTEGVRIVSEGITEFAGVDDLLREGGPGFRMGPFELMDITGLDVSQVVMESIYHQFSEEPRFRPLPLTRQRFEGGVFGRKSGGGFYDYDEDGRKLVPVLPKISTDLPESVWVSPTDEAGHAALTGALAGKVDIDTGKRPSAKSLCLLTPVGYDATTEAVRQGVEAERSFAVDCMFGLDGRRTLMSTPVSDPNLRDQVHALLAADGNAVTAIYDSPGFVNQRVVATVVNIACDIAQNRIAVPIDIDKAVRLGLAYPLGPLAMGDHVGALNILAVLNAMADFYGDPRYRPSPWLKRRALLGVSLLTPEG